MQELSIRGAVICEGANSWTASFGRTECLTRVLLTSCPWFLLCRERFLIPPGTSPYGWKLRGTLVPRSKVVSHPSISRDTCHETRQSYPPRPPTRPRYIVSGLIHRSGFKSQCLLPYSRWRLLLLDIGSGINPRRQYGKPSSYRY